MRNNSMDECMTCTGKYSLAPALVQIGGLAENFPINLDTLSIEEDSIPDGGRGGIFDPEGAKVELILANAMHQLDA